MPGLGPSLMEVPNPSYEELLQMCESQQVTIQKQQLEIQQLT